MEWVPAFNQNIGEAREMVHRQRRLGDRVNVAAQHRAAEIRRITGSNVTPS
jgi:hypothetical protein